MLSLEKGSKLNLSKEGGLDWARVGLGWTPRKFDSQADFDLDVSAFVLKDDGTPFGSVLCQPKETNGWVLYFGQLDVGNGALIHHGDERTGDTDGDDETIDIDFTKLPPEASKIAVIVTIYQADVRKQNFGQIDDAYCKIYDKAGVARAEFDLDENASTSTALMFVEFKKNSSGEWVMSCVGEGFNKGLGDFFKAFKVPGHN